MLKNLFWVSYGMTGISQMYAECLEESIEHYDPELIDACDQYNDFGYEIGVYMCRLHDKLPKYVKVYLKLLEESDQSI